MTNTNMTERVVSRVEHYDDYVECVARKTDGLTQYTCRASVGGVQFETSLAGARRLFRLLEQLPSPVFTDPVTPLMD